MIDALCRCGNATRQRTCRLSGIDGGFVHEHDRDVVFNGIDAAALGALKGLSFVLELEWLFAKRADEKIEEFLRNHAKILAGDKRESQICLVTTETHGICRNCEFQGIVVQSWLKRRRNRRKHSRAFRFSRIEMRQTGGMEFPGMGRDRAAISPKRSHGNDLASLLDCNRDLPASATFEADRSGRASARDSHDEIFRRLLETGCLMFMGDFGKGKAVSTSIYGSRLHLFHAAGSSSGGRNIALARVVHHHAIGVETPAESANRSFHSFDPAAGKAVDIAFVVKRDHFVAKNTIEILAIASIVYVYIRMSAAGADGEAVQPVIGFRPPAIEN